MNNKYNFSRFFSQVQESPWYQEYLNPVVEEINHQSQVLDIGTGSGKLIQRLFLEKSADCIGTDSNLEMLHEAELKLNGIPAKLIHIKRGENFPFQEKSFAVICLCNVLFNLNNADQDFLLQQCLTLLKSDGKIIVLSPSGRGSILNLILKFFQNENKSIGLWYALTKKRALDWTVSKKLQLFSEKNGLRYTNRLVFYDFGHLEIISF
jgi:ubiquinone/menaquinone biosynthesis C-methylase UbiE